MPPTVDLACPVPSCNYAPPSSLSRAGQEKALGKHIESTHSLSDFPAVVDAISVEHKSTVTEEPQPVAEETKPEPKPEAVKVQQRPTRAAASKPVAPIVPIDPKRERIEDRAKRWGQYLYNDLNPMLVVGASQLAGVPEPWLKGGPGPAGEAVTLPLPDGKTVTFWNPTLETQLSLSKKECERIAKAGATFAESPMGMALDAWLQHNSHYIALGGALWAAGAYGWRVMRIKGEVTQLKEVIEAQAKMAHMGNQEAGQQPFPNSESYAAEAAYAAAQAATEAAENVA